VSSIWVTLRSTRAGLSDRVPVYLLMSLLGELARSQDRSRLVASALAGDAGAARELVALLAPIVRSRAASALLRRGRRAGRSIEQELEDLGQEVLLALFDQGGKRLAAWSPDGGALEAWVGVVAEREIASILRSGRRTPWKDEPTADAEVERLHEPQRRDEERVASRELLARLLDRLRERLSPQGLQMFYALYAEEKSIEVVCAESGLRADAVYAWRSRLSRLCRELADEIEEERGGRSGKPRARRSGERSSVQA
jgi:RNA polymerase sigma-70 factor (ECF subfamily)